MAISLAVDGVLDHVWQTTAAIDGQAKLATMVPCIFNPIAPYNVC